jgi:hypothetical protein
MELEQGQKRAALGQKLAGKFTRRGGCPGCPVTERDCVEQSRLHANVTPRPTAPRQRQSEPTGLSLDTAFGNGSPADGAKRKGPQCMGRQHRFYDRARRAVAPAHAWGAVDRGKMPDPRPTAA